MYKQYDIDDEINKVERACILLVSTFVIRSNRSETNRITRFDKGIFLCALKEELEDVFIPIPYISIFSPLLRSMAIELRENDMFAFALPRERIWCNELKNHN